MAATVIDAFVVALGLDSTQFDKNAAKAKKTQQEVASQANKNSKDREGQGRKLSDSEKKFQKEAEARAKSTKEGLAKVRNEVLLLVSAFTAGIGIKDFFSSTINTAANLGYLSANLGMTTERIQAYQRASERAGGTAEGMTAQLKESVDTLAQLKLGMGPSEGLQWFFRMGGSSSDLQNGNTYLMARSKIIHDMFQVDPGKAALMARQMGISEDQFNLIKQGPQAVQDLIAAQEKHSAISAKDAAAALELKNKMLDLRDSLEQTATRIVLQLAPSIEKLFEQLEKGADWVAAHKDDISRWIDDDIKSLKDFIRVADDVAQALGGWQNVLIGLAAFKAISTVGELLLLAGALGNVAGALKTVALSKAGLVGLAGAAGYGVGTLIYDNLGDKAKDMIGEYMARTMASLGSKTAGESIRVNTGSDDFLTGPGATHGYVKSKQIFSDLETKYKLPAGLLDSVWNAESSRGKNMLSPAGAMGHFQFMPKTAAEFGLKDPYDLGQSADAAARKLQGLLKQYNGDVGMATAAYNWGQGNLNKNGMQNAPAETKNYVDKIAANMGQANAMAATQIPSGSATSVSGRVDNSKSSSSTSDTTINGGITIVTQATDTKGIASEIKPAIEKYNSTMQANTGIR